MTTTTGIRAMALTTQELVDISEQLFFAALEAQKRKQFDRAQRYRKLSDRALDLRYADDQD